MNTPHDDGPGHKRKSRAKPGLPPLKLPLPKVINLLTDLKEERDVAAKNSWVIDPVVRIIGEFEASLKKYPPIPMGTADPYAPPVP